MVTIPVPSQPKLHKQWCLFDQVENIDFDREVRKIAGDVEEALKKTVNENLEEEDNTGSDLSADSADRFISELTLLDVQSPVKRDLQPVFEDFSSIQEFARGVKEKVSIALDKEN